MGFGRWNEAVVGDVLVSHCWKHSGQSPLPTAPLVLKPPTGSSDQGLPGPEQYLPC